MKPDWADHVAVRAKCGNLSGNELTRNLSGNILPQSSQLAEPLWTDPGIKNEISVHELISTSTTTTKAKKALARNELSNILPRSSQARKKPPHVFWPQSRSDCRLTILLRLSVGTYQVNPVVSAR